MKLIKRMTALILALTLLLGIAACGKKGEDGGVDGEGNYKPSEKGTLLNFWGWGDSTEGQVFNELTDRFNDTVGKENNITVKYSKIPSNQYVNNTQVALAGNTPPDVVYVGDGDVKAWSTQGWLERLDAPDNNYLERAGGFDLTDIWPSAVQRYRYNPETTTSNADDPLWGLPKDIGPTVIYYNKTLMDAAGVTVVSVPEEEIESMVGKTVGGTQKTYTRRGYDAAQKVFNNRIPMSWEETVELARLLKNDTRADFGFFTEWWFNYGWSVGGDVVEYLTDEMGSYYKFTLGDATPNYIVKDGGDPITVAGREYKAGEIVSYAHKGALSADDKAKCNELPSTREAFTEFCRLAAAEDVTVDTVGGKALKGYNVAMNPATLGTADYETYFTSGKCAMYVDGRWATATMRELMRDDWDVAPLPVYRSYNADGTVKAHGVPSGHSGSMSVAITSGSKNKNAAWLFVRFIAGEDGQAAQSKKGFAIPNQMTLARDEEVFLQSNQKPHNSVIFLDAAAVQRPGDWTYLKDSEWINIWAPTLNGDVRNGKMNLTKFFDTYSAPTQTQLYTYTDYKG